MKNVSGCSQISTKLVNIRFVKEKLSRKIFPVQKIKNVARRRERHCVVRLRAMILRLRRPRSKFARGDRIL